MSLCLYICLFAAVLPSDSASAGNDDTGLQLLQLSASATHEKEERMLGVNRSLVDRRKGGWGVAFAGLEGTGHHFWYGLLNMCVSARACHQPSKGVLDSVKDGQMKAHMSDFQTDLDKRWMREQAAGGPTLVFPLPSWPNGDPGRYPQLSELYATAKRHGDGLKVVILLRDVQDLMWSNRKRWYRTDDTEIDAARELIAQLQTVDAADRVCVEYDAVPAIAQTFAAMMSPRLASSPEMPNRRDIRLEGVFDWEGFDWSRVIPKGTFDRAPGKAVGWARAVRHNYASAEKHCIGANSHSKDCDRAPELEDAMDKLRGMCKYSPHFSVTAVDEPDILGTRFSGAEEFLRYIFGDV